MDRIWYKSYDSRVPQIVESPRECLPLQLEKRAREHPQRIACEFFGAKLSYGALWKQVLQLAGSLKALGVVRGTKVAIMLPNCPQAIITYYATQWLGAVVVLTNPMYVQREMEHQWRDSEAEFLVVLDHLYPKVQRALPITKIRKVIVTTIKDYLPFYLKYLYPLKAIKKKLFTKVPYGPQVLNFSRLIRESSSEPPRCTATLNDLALLQYTGGTTGVSKGVMLSHGNILANVVQITAWFQDIRREGERFLAVLPFFHVFGMTVAMNFPLYTGSCIILLPRFEVIELLKTLKKSKPSLFPGVPTIFMALVNHPDIGRYDLSSLRLCITGSAPMPVETLKQFEEMTGSIIVEGYGLTEASPVTHCNPVDGIRKTGSVGMPLPATDCKLVDLEDGISEKQIGEIGELVVRGPQVMEGYWKISEVDSGTLRDGWLYTGDIATMDEDGYFFVVDRKKDLIIAGGYNIYPREIDEVLYEHPKVLDAAAIGVHHPYRGETVKAFIVPKPGEKITEGEIIEYCKERLAAYKVPKLVEFRDSLPKTMVGKISRKELKKEAAQQETTSGNDK
jgi:long-chain acyl-CoA synthetase